MLGFPEWITNVMIPADAMNAGFTVNSEILPNTDSAVLQTICDAYHLIMRPPT